MLRQISNQVTCCGAKVGAPVVLETPNEKGLAEAKPLNRLVETRRIELLTSALRTQRSPS